MGTKYLIDEGDRVCKVLQSLNPHKTIHLRTGPGGRSSCMSFIYKWLTYLLYMICVRSSGPITNMDPYIVKSYNDVVIMKKMIPDSKSRMYYTRSVVFERVCLIV